MFTSQVPQAHYHHSSGNEQIQRLITGVPALIPSNDIIIRSQ